MSSKNLATVTTELIACYGNTARNVIQAYRVGNERMASYVDQRWASAVNKVGTQLTPEIRTNALAAQQKVFAYYARGVNLTTDGADGAVNKAVELAGKGVEQVAANASRFEKATGFTALNVVATAAVPAVVAVSSVAAKIEVKSVALVQAVAGTKAKPKAKAKAKRTTRKVVAAVKRPVARKPVAKKAAAPVVKQVAEAIAA